MGAWKDIIRQEIASGGSLSPCPFCGLPRSQRSDYVRCCACGINWCQGEALDHDPRIGRLNKFLEDMKATNRPKEVKS